MEQLKIDFMQRLLLLLICSFFCVPAANAVIAIKKFETQIEDAKTVLIGMIKVGRQGQVILVVETSLKGGGRPNDEIIVDENSKLAWQLVDGGGPMLPANHSDFVRQIQQADWYQKRAVLVGSIKEGKWLSYCYDWSVWTSGVSTRDETLKDLSFEELVEVIKSKLGKSTATHQAPTASQATKAAPPATVPNPTSPVVQPTESTKESEARRTVLTSSEGSPLSTPWSIIVVLIMVVGLLWWFLKRRS
jgi:hypothetical protein